MRKVAGQRLLLARLDWERLFSSANPPGAVAPSTAKETLTRDSRRRWENIRKARRGSASKSEMVAILANLKARKQLRPQDAA
jgi:hypothetical protein